jgi:AAHS family benzoate transporter-like MFS transporter
MGRFGAVFGPWLGGQLLAADKGDWGFTAFALAGTASTVFIGIAALRTARPERRDGEPRHLVATG